jgi:hypothetical protein
MAIGINSGVRRKFRPNRLVDEAVTVGVASGDADAAVSTLDASNAVAARSVIARDEWGRIGAGVGAVVGRGI